MYEELPSLFGSSPKRVALESHSSALSTQSELLCGEWLGYMSLDSSFDVALHSSPSRTSNSSSASADSVLSVGTNDSEKAQGHPTGGCYPPYLADLPTEGLQATHGSLSCDADLTVLLVAHVVCAELFDLQSRRTGPRAVFRDMQWCAGLGLHSRSTGGDPVTCCCELTAEPPGPACFGWGLWNVPEDCVVYCSPNDLSLMVSQAASFMSSGIGMPCYTFCTSLHV